MMDDCEELAVNVVLEKRGGIFVRWPGPLKREIGGWYRTAHSHKCATVAEAIKYAAETLDADIISFKYPK
jgi:hypothetical protein